MAIASTPAASNAATLRRASERAVSRSPAWACRAPQHPWRGTVTTRYPLARRTRTVAWLTRANSPAWTHPVRIPTVAWAGLVGGRGVGAGAGGGGAGRAGAGLGSGGGGAEAASIAMPSRAPPGGPAPAGSRVSSAGIRVARRRRPASMASRTIHAVPNTRRTARTRSGGRRASRPTCRASSRRWPYSTPEGQTGSQARQPRQRPTWVWKASAPGSSLPSTTACIRYSRPRGESASSPRRR